MKRWKIGITAVLALAVLAFAGTANAIKLRAGNIIIIADGGFTPTKLPRTRKRPDHDPRRRQDLDRERRAAPDPGNDRHRIRPPRLGRNDRPAGLQAGPARGDHRQPGAQVLRRLDRRQGQRHARSSSSRNRRRSRPPRRSRSSTARKRAATRPCSPTPTSPIPVSTTFIVPVVIEKINKGIYGYRTKGKIPKIANGAGHPDLRQPDDRQKMDLQGQEAQLRQRPLRNRAACRPAASSPSKTAPSSAATFLRPCTGPRLAAAPAPG